MFYDYFDTVGTFMDYSGMSDEKFDALADRVEATLAEFHKLYDIYNEYEGITNLASVNKNAGNGQLKVDEKIVDMLLYSKQMYSLTGGKVNVAMGAVLEIWHNYRTAGKEIPGMDILTAAAEHTDINSLVIDEENLTVELLDPKMSLDVGAIAKGYAVEMTAKMLEAEGYTSLVLDVGGNLRAIGEKPSGKGWTAGVTNPASPYSQTYVYTMEIKNAALVTSGGYQRFYMVDGVRYHHIINGETLMPENYYLSVSIKSPSSALSDALSTAVFNMKYEDAAAFIDKLDGVFAVFVLPDGEVRCAGK
ncbi:MAG: FAD:protein FMN transferase [Ruminococcaceae bacterium]|nr:FAD:protein FMN transferase [Oscillospiraceae bacterium]